MKSKILIIFLIFCILVPFASADWNNGSEYRKSHIINQTVGAGTDYQVKINIFPGNGTDSGNTVYLNNNASYFPNDINFTTSDGTTLLNHWYDGNNTFYVKIPNDLNTSNTTIYLYYGLSSGNSTKINPTSDTDKWIRYSSNPVLTAGTGGAWDDSWVQIHSIVNVSGTYYGYYVGSTNVGAVHGQTGLATSTNGITWSKNEGNPVIPHGTAGQWDDDATGYPLVWKEGSNWYALYSGGKSDLYRKFGLATSTDGISWTKYGSSPVLSNGSAGTWDSQYLLPGTTMLKEGNTYYLFYMGGSDVSDSGTWNIGLATSTNLVNWTKNPNNPIITGTADTFEDGILEPHVQKFGDTYYMWYQTSEYNGDRTRIALATSSNKINWTKSQNNPIFNDNTNNHVVELWDDWYAESPIIIDMGDHWNMYYMSTKYLAVDIETGFATYQKTGNGSATFLKFDDFNNYKNASYTNNGAYQVDRGELWKYGANTNTQYNIISTETFPNSVAIETKVRTGADWSNEWGWNFILSYDNGFAQSGYLAGKYYTDIDNYFGLFTFPAGDSYKTNESISADTYYNLTLKVSNETQYFYVNDVLKGMLITTPPQTSNPITLTTTRSSSNSDFTTYFDRLFVRKYNDPEPGNGAWGVQEQYTPEPAQEVYGDKFKVSGYVNNSLGVPINGVQVDFDGHSTYTKMTATVNNTDKHASGERTQGVTYKQEYDIDLYILTKNDAAGDMYIRMFVNDVLVQDDDYHIVAASPGNRSKWYRIPSYMPYRVDIDSTSMDYQWREYTLEDGYWEFDNLSEGNYSLLFRSVGYRNYTQNITLSSNLTINATMIEMRYPTLISLDSGIIIGVVVLALITFIFFKRR